jgi:hypothetical protein
MAQLPAEGLFELGDLALQSGVVLPNATIGYHEIKALLAA